MEKENVVEKNVEKQNVKDEQKKSNKKGKPLKKILKFIKGMKVTTKIIISLSLVIAAFLGVWLASIVGEESKLTTISESSLQKIIEINELSTVDYIYNATATKTTEDGSEVMYYVAYEGTVKAGIDFSKITFNIVEEQKIINVKIPEISIQNFSVDMGTMDFIFTKDKYETETVSQEAYKLCKADLKKRVEKEELLRDTARENAKASVEALFKPWIETIDKEYKVVVE